MNYDEETPWKRSAGDARVWAALRTRAERAAKLASAPEVVVGRELALIQPVLVSACSKEDIGLLPHTRVRNRMLRFLDELARALAAWYVSRPETAHVRVISKAREEHRAPLGLDELMFDIVACEVTSATMPGTDLPRLLATRVLWEIVTAFDSSPAEALTRFNKLVLGGGAAKLLIAHHTPHDAAYLRALWTSARCCSGMVFAALITHPARWHREALTVSTFVAGERGWMPI